MSDANVAALAQEKFESERAEKQGRHLAECTVKDCRTCRIFRGEPPGDPETPRCPTCNAWGYLGPTDRARTIVQKLTARLLKRAQDHHDEQHSGTLAACSGCSADVALLRDAGAL